MLVASARMSQGPAVRHCEWRLGLEAVGRVLGFFVVAGFFVCLGLGFGLVWFGF